MFRAHTMFAGVFVLAWLPAVQPASAQAKFTVLFNFGGGVGRYPEAPVVTGNDGVLYGVTDEGGMGTCAYVGTCGIVFSLAPPASGSGQWTEAVIHDFTGGSDGASPSGLSMGSDGVLYGTTNFGGSGSCNFAGLTGCGTVFSLTPPASPGGAWTETVIYSFAGGPTDGALPRGGVIVGPDGILYGTTEYGGPNSGASGECEVLFTGCGTVFSLTPPPGGPGSDGVWTEAVLYVFAGGFDDGGNPFAGVTLVGSALYGTTYYGGNQDCTYGCGTVFGLTPPSTPGGAWTEQVLFKFMDTGNASHPSAGLLAVTAASGTVLYGTTTYGGDSGLGAVYSLTSTGGPWIERLLYSFSGGSFGPIGGVVRSASGFLYGTTAGDGKNNDGTIFQLRPPANGSGDPWTETTLHQFANGGGEEPEATLTIGSDGVLYGTAYAGGAKGKGTVFSLLP